MTDDTSKFDARIQHPFRMILSGPSGSGKTFFVNNLIANSQTLINPPPKNIVWFYGIETKGIKTSPEPFNDKNIRYVKGIPENFEEYLGPQTLFIFDDLMQEASNNKKLTKLFTKQSHHWNVSVVLILQNLYYSGSERKTFFRNAQYLVLFSSPLDKSAVYAVAHRIMPKRVQSFLKVFEMATYRPFGYLYIDGAQNTPTDARLRTDIFKPYQRVFIPQIWKPLVVGIIYIC